MQVEAVKTQVPEKLVLVFENETVSHFQVNFHKDLPVYIPISTNDSWTSFIEKQLDVYVDEGPGHYTRPVALRDAKAINVKEDGSFTIYWKNGMRSRVSAASVASYAVL